MSQRLYTVITTFCYAVIIASAFLFDGVGHAMHPWVGGIAIAFGLLSATVYVYQRSTSTVSQTPPEEKLTAADETPFQILKFPQEKSEYLLAYSNLERVRSSKDRRAYPADLWVAGGSNATHYFAPISAGREEWVKAVESAEGSVPLAVDVFRHLSEMKLRPQYEIVVRKNDVWIRAVERKERMVVEPPSPTSESFEFGSSAAGLKAS